VSQKELQQMILKGEHQNQSYKFANTDTKSIARTIAAFANTDGGHLFFGVKDNGNIVGIESDETDQMVESAANSQCRPSVPFETKKWDIDGKTVLEVIIEKSKKRPHAAPDEDGKATYYVRVKDQNLVANRILIEVWKREKNPGGAMLKIKYAESKLLTYLGLNGHITFSKFCGMANISPRKAEKILINLVHMKVIEMDIMEHQIYYKMNSKPEYPEPNQDLPEDW